MNRYLLPRMGKRELSSLKDGVYGQRLHFICSLAPILARSLTIGNVEMNDTRETLLPPHLGPNTVPLTAKLRPGPSQPTPVDPKAICLCYFQEPGPRCSSDSQAHVVETLTVTCPHTCLFGNQGADLWQGLFLVSASGSRS